MTDQEPLVLHEDERTGDRFLVYGTGHGVRLDIRYEGETLWMTQAQIAQIFGVDRSVVTKHITNVYAEGELDADSTSARIAQVRQEGSRTVERQIEHYNLDAVISVGYRVSSAQATIFRRWATGILVQFAKKAFVVGTHRLKQPENADRVAELRDIVRDISSRRGQCLPRAEADLLNAKITTAHRKPGLSSTVTLKQNCCSRSPRTLRRKSSHQERMPILQTWA